MRKLLTGLALGLDRAGKEGPVALQGAVQRRFRLILPPVRPGAGFRLRTARFQEGIGGEQVHVAMEVVCARQRDHVQIAARCAAELGSDIGCRNPEFRHGFVPDRDTAGAGGLVAIVQAVD